MFECLSNLIRPCWHYFLTYRQLPLGRVVASAAQHKETAMFWRVGAVALALMLGGCADGEDDSGGASPVEPGATSSSKAASDSSFDKDAARALAKSALFVIGDFPAGWGATPADPDTSEGEELQKQLSECLDAPSNLFGKGSDGVSEDSSDFNSPDENTTVSSSVSVAAPGRMRQFFDVMKGENVSGCLSEAMNAAVQAELKKSTRWRSSIAVSLPENGGRVRAGGWLRPGSGMV